jgi:hypothetical protein
MKATLLLSTLVLALIAATSSFAQAVNSGPTRAYDSHGYYQESGTAAADHQHRAEPR